MSDNTTVREWLEDALKPVLPSGWRIIPNQRIPETIDRITVVIKHIRIAPLAEAPKGHLSNDVIITVADPHTDQARAEDALDDEVLELVNALQTIAGITWTGADKVLVNTTDNLGWDIACSIISRKKAPTNG